MAVVSLIIAIAAAVLAVGGTLVLRLVPRGISVSTTTRNAEMASLKRELAEVQRVAPLRVDLLLAEYDAKIRQWKLEGYQDLREVEALIASTRRARGQQ
jgi:hypothetical protein